MRKSQPADKAGSADKLKKILSAGPEFHFEKLDKWPLSAVSFVSAGVYIGSIHGRRQDADGVPFCLRSIPVYY